MSVFRCFSTSNISAIANGNKLDELVSKSADPGELLIIIPDKPNVVSMKRTFDNKT